MLLLMTSSPSPLYKGFDPEASTSATSGMGVDKGAYPTSKKVVVGATIEF